MSIFRSAPLLLLASSILFPQPAAPLQSPAQKAEEDTGQLPSELRGAKIYKIPDETKPGEAVENPVIFKNLSYQDISFERLALNLFLSIKPVERAATIRKVYFQNIRVNGIPVHIETFDQEFKLSKKDVVEVPAPLLCTIAFNELESLAPVKEVVSQDKIRVTGQSFVEVKLNAVEKIALRTKRLVLPVTLNEEVPLQMFSGNPFLQMAAARILDTLSDPSTAAGIALAKEHLAKVNEDRTVESAARPAVYLLYCEYALKNPKTQATEKFSQSGTGFLVTADGKLLTAKRVVQPWKFDPQVAFLAGRYNLELDPNSYRLFAWPSGSRVISPEGQLDFQSALSTEKQTLKLLKTAADKTEKRDYQDPDSEEKAQLSLHAPGESDLAVLELVGVNSQPLAFADPNVKVSPELKTTLFGFPFGLSQALANPRPTAVKAEMQDPLIKLDHHFNAGEPGAPLLAPDGKVLAVAGGTDECIPIEKVRSLIQ